jgi:uncharacterized protein YaaW (UPF0174 family)
VGNIIEIAAINAQTSSFLELIEYANKRILPDASDKLKKNKKYETSGTSLISDSIKEKSFNAFIIRLITLILFILCLE